MPIYEYQCKGCCHKFEYLHFKADEPAPNCPECNCADVDRLLSAGAIRAQGIPTGSGGFQPPPCKPSG